MSQYIVKFVMPTQLTIMFGKEEELLDDRIRQQKLDQGIAQIEAQKIEGIALGTRINIACAVVVRGTPSGIRNLKEFLKNGQLGFYQEDAIGSAPLRSAGNGHTS